MGHGDVMTASKVLFVVIVATVFCTGCFGDKVKENNNKDDVKNPTSNVNNKTLSKSSSPNHQTTTKRYDDNSATISAIEDVTAPTDQESQEDANTKKIDKDKIQKEDNYCFPKIENKNTVSENFDGDEIKRIVVYFYIVRDKDGNVKEFMYIPDINKQRQLPDLPSQNDDLIILAKHLTVKEILNNHNPYIINDKEYPSVPKKRRKKIIKRSKIDNFKNTLPTNCYDTDKGTICENEHGDVIKRRLNEKDTNLQVEENKESDVSDEDGFSNDEQQTSDEENFLTKRKKEKVSKSKTKLSKHNRPSSAELFNVLSDNDHNKVEDEVDSYETELDSFQYDSEETSQSKEQLQPKHPKSYDKWINSQILANSNNFKKNSNLKLMKADILKGLSEKGFTINKNGKIKDRHGNSYNMANIKLVSIFNSETKYHKNGGKQIKYVIVVSQMPFKILVIIPINNKLNKPEKSNPNFSPTDRNEELNPDQDQDPELSNEPKTKCITGCLKRRCRSKRSNPYPYEDIFKHIMPCPGCKFPMNISENKQKKDLTDILVRILGGSAAMGSGNPIRNKGRSNIVSEDSSEK